MQKITLLALVLFTIPVHAWAGLGRCPEPDTQTCLDHMVARHHQGWLGFEYERRDEGSVQIREVTRYSPASHAGFRVGDILLTMNGADFGDPSSVKKARGDWLPGQFVSYTVRRGTTSKRIAVRLGRQPEKDFVRMVGRHMLENHVGAAYAAIPGEGVEVIGTR
jgi:C-terminal processing protease CtpA/Prc